MGLLYLTGSILVLHAAYSSFEYHQFIKASKNHTGLPYDIVFELLIGLVIFILGSIQSIKNESRISLKEDKLIKQGDEYLNPIKMNESMENINNLGINDYEEFENRIDFINFREKRKLYNEWIKNK
ncbi:hypothetical protein HYPBUDRAFT_12029 [Hyphopichia burtonii NRRL Y-1933]|uniref:Magnesium transporter n=1 Tax=Hyphopichia burtonii NRRL Y-1933 TaxID=984485 RepID=A0A1E4RGD1_9ASCO|nr:hypothetical protein HYPBUDRAFT_12029 [Hyphopichia burtonii NRRL Y-1933]ODV66319.1 hypothetical protein HYPBUDRAFT_12029 [Hyphopichia burtonii NRRL Y-1933]